MADPERPQREVFASPEDIVTAHTVAEEVLGPGFDVNYLAMPKSVGAKGDEGVRGASVLISTNNGDALRQLLVDARQKDREYREYLRECLADLKTGYRPFEDTPLDVVMREIGNRTTATKVLLDITPNGGRFKSQ